jgi:hypothetical protein
MREKVRNKTDQRGKGRSKVGIVMAALNAIKWNALLKAIA